MSPCSNFAGLLHLEEHEESNSATTGSVVGTSMHLISPTFVSSTCLGLMWWYDSLKAHHWENTFSDHTPDISTHLHLPSAPQNDIQSMRAMVEQMVCFFLLSQLSADFLQSFAISLQCVDHSHGEQVTVQSLSNPQDIQSMRTTVKQMVHFFCFVRIICWVLQSFAIDLQLMDHPHSKQIRAAPGASQESVFKNKSNSAPICLLNAGKQSVGPSPRKSSTWDDWVRPTNNLQSALWLSRGSEAW